MTPAPSITEKGKDATMKFDCNLDGLIGLLVAEILPGSVVLTLKAAYIDTLPNGTHTVELRFTNGYGTAQVVVNRSTAPTTPQNITPTTGSPQTGDSSNMPLWLGLGISALLGLALLATKAKSYC